MSIKFVVKQYYRTPAGVFWIEGDTADLLPEDLEQMPLDLLQDFGEVFEPVDPVLAQPFLDRIPRAIARAQEEV